MAEGLRIGEVAAKSGFSRKALKVYEAHGILPPPRRTPAGYRVYASDVLPILAFVAQSRRLGLTLSEIRRIVALRCAGPGPCLHVRGLLEQKVGGSIPGMLPVAARAPCAPTAKGKEVRPHGQAHALSGLRELPRSRPGRRVHPHRPGRCPEGHVERPSRCDQGRAARSSMIRWASGLDQAPTPLSRKSERLPAGVVTQFD